MSADKTVFYRLLTMMLTGGIIGATTYGLSRLGEPDVLSEGTVTVISDVPPLDRADEEPDAGPEPTVHIAMMRDFAGFTDWDRYPVEGAMLPVGVPNGPTYIYASRAPTHGRARWPVGTMLVKVIESGPAAAEWTIHAMVKRGVPYNADGALGWEFFELSLESLASDPVIVWRGPGPPSGHGYAAANTDAGAGGVPLVCNDCHSANWRDDGVLTEALAIRR